MNETVLERQAHAHLDLTSRERKAQKIEQLLNLRPSETLRLLEVGTGSGGIAHYFATRSALKCDVVAVDVRDNRVVRDGYEYRQVEGVDLPFDTASFDVVISNHVMEHVGATDAQRRHVAELHRVLRPDGIAYLAVPNRWMLVEAHYHLAFLSWLPEAWRTPYLRWSGQGAEYDCRPLTERQARRLLEQAGFAACQQTGRAVRQAYQLERPQSWAYRLLWRWLPDVAYRPLRPVFPTLIYVLSKSGHRYDRR